jgi:hypothetical protein
VTARIIAVAFLAALVIFAIAYRAIAASVPPVIVTHGGIFYEDGYPAPMLRCQNNSPRDWTVVDGRRRVRLPHYALTEINR